MEPTPIIIEGPEQSLVDPALPDAGLSPAVGVQSNCVFRASRDVPELTDERGWTYHHHVDMACWRGRLYVGWNSCEKDEDIWPSRELYSTSIDGATWSSPREMFPQGVSTCLRMYFYRASNDRMLIIAGLRTGEQKTDEDRKGGLVVREIRADHTLGDVFVLQGEPSDHVSTITKFERASDAGFVATCRELLDNTVFLEQQDRGRLLGVRAMKWHDPRSWPGGKVPGDNEKWVSGKAFSFFRRKEGLLVGVSKMGWTTTSNDDGKTWSQPEVPPSLITGKAKVWSQRTSDGRFALVYNPTTRTRYPLCVVTSDDGQHFRDMRIVQGELPIQRYAGKDRSIGPQYVRGISHWADDGSRANDQAIWLVYSMNKEDIWVSRVPLPVKPRVTGRDDSWNTYCPKWATIQCTDEAMRIEDRDPFDYARATRIFPPGGKVTVQFTVEVVEATRASLEIELMSEFGSRRPVRVIFGFEGKIHAVDGSRMVTVGSYDRREPVAISIEADATRQRYSLSLDRRLVLTDASFPEPAQDLARISFRTGAYRGIGGKQPVEAGTDRPIDPITYTIGKLQIRCEEEDDEHKTS